ncbi:Stf0 family sulfotransferase [Sulfitobacter sp. LCG007]
MKSYILCATPRSGSTMLCDLLSATGVAGVPDSYFMRAPGPEWAAAWRLPDEDGRGTAEHARAYLDAAIASGTGSTGVFGLRLMQESLDDLRELIDLRVPGCPDDRTRLEAVFGEVTCLHLSRTDKLAQAVSRVRAEQTGLWHAAPDGTEIERLAPPAEPEYDRPRIAARLAGIEAQDRAWDNWFTREGIEPLRLRYEDLAADPASVLRRICDRLGVALPADHRIAPGTARLADETSARWMRRFRSETARSAAPRA